MAPCLRGEVPVEGAMAGAGQQLGCACGMVGRNVVIDNRVNHALRQAGRDGQDLGLDVREPGGALPSPHLHQNIIKKQLHCAGSTD